MQEKELLTTRAAERPNRLTPTVHALTLVLLTASFITGVLIWRAVYLQETRAETRTWLRACVVLHGVLNPFLCAVFGYFLCDHIRVGWQLRANRISGFLMEACFVALILTAIGLYYSGGENFRTFFIWTHRILGLAMPVCLIAHWIAARRLVANIEGSRVSRGH